MMIESKIRINVSMYMDRKKLSKDVVYAMTIFTFCFISILIISLLLADIFYVPSVHIDRYINIYGVMVPETLLQILAVCIGLAWVIHGFGFIVVRR